MLVFCNRSKHVTDAARRFATLLRCCIWSSSASPTLTVWAAAAEAVINALSGLWQQTEAITCSVFPLALTHQTLLIPHLGHIHQQFIERKKNVLPLCTLPVTVVAKAFVCPDITSFFTMHKNILFLGAHPVVFIYRSLCDDSRPAKKNTDYEVSHRQLPIKSAQTGRTGNTIVLECTNVGQQKKKVHHTQTASGSDARQI